MQTIYHRTALTTVACCTCGGAIGLNEIWVANARSEGNQRHQFWCPYCGVRQGWGGKSKEEKLREEIAQLQKLQQVLKDSRKRALAEAEHFRRSRDGMKGVVAKIKNRVGRGVCPCCNRHFTNLERHMKSKHPEMAQGHGAAQSPS